MPCYAAMMRKQESHCKNNPLYEEEHTKYVEPQHPIVFLPWDHTKFIYQSQRDGYNHLYLMDTKTSIYPESHGASAGGSYRESYKTRQLTQGNWVVQNILGFNEKTKEVIIMSTEVYPFAEQRIRCECKDRQTPPHRQ